MLCPMNIKRKCTSKPNSEKQVKRANSYSIIILCLCNCACTICISQKRIETRTKTLKKESNVGMLLTGKQSTETSYMYRDGAYWFTEHRNKLHVGCHHKKQCDETTHNNPWPYMISESNQTAIPYISSYPIACLLGFFLPFHSFFHVE